MNTKILTTFLLSALLITTFVAAEVFETNYFFDGDTNEELTNVDATIYVCQDEACDTATKLWKNIEDPDKTNNFIVLTYPTVLASEFGYMTYFFKPGYVPTKVPADWAGNGNAGEYDNFLYKIQDTAKAPVEDFKVDDKTAKIDQEITISANILSPRLNSDNVKFIPQELIADYYSDEVEVSLQINGVTVESQTIKMLWSTEQEVEFTWTPTEEGDFTAQIITELTDAKFTNTEDKQTQEIEIEVKGTYVPVDEKDNKYITGYKRINMDDTIEDDEYLNQYTGIMLDDEQFQESKL